MKELESRHGGVEYRIVYDTTVFGRNRLGVYHTLIEAFILVFHVVLVFLQNCGPTVPMVAVPVYRHLRLHGDAGIL